MDVDNSPSEAILPSNNHHHENGLTNGYSSSDKHKSSSSKSEHKEKRRDKDRDHKSSRSKEHKSSSSRDKDKERHHGSSKDHKSSSSSHKSSSRDKDKDRHRDKERHKSSSSRDKYKDKDREHRSSKDHKSKDKDRDKERSREHRDKDKERSRDKDKERHRHSSSGKDKHRDKDRHRDKDSDKERKDRKSDKHKEESPEKPIVEIKAEPESQHNGSSYNYDDIKKVEKDEYEEDDKYANQNSSQASSCDYNMSQFKEEESKFEVDEDQEEEQEEAEDSEEDKPLAQRLQSVKRKLIDSDEDEKPEVRTKKANKTKSKKRSHSDTEDEDVKPSKEKKKKKATPAAAVVKKEEDGSPKKRKKKKVEEEQEVWKWWEEEKKDDGTKWKFLEHKGPVFPPPYERLPKNVKFYYDGAEVSLSQDAEEVAGFYAKMLDHDYTTKEVFNTNFFKDWRKTMTDEERKKITDLKKCNFKQMNAYFTDLAEKNRNRSKEEKLAIKEQNEATIKEYGICTIDGHKEKIGNFRIEPPGLFRGRGEHPKMGLLKKRIRPEDLLINCSKDSCIPKPPPGHKWKEVRHDPTVTWLVSWTENVQNQVKYIMLNPSSKLKGEKDWQKYETARRLHKCIDKIRSEYKADWKSKEMRFRQRAVALYFIDKLALRAGNEKDEDQADTVGCCSLRVEHISLHERKDNKEYVVVFDFPGKDSIRYYNEVPVEKRVFKNLQLFMENKSAGDDLFDRLNTAVLNKHLNELMEGLTAKVFRTYNASFTLQQQLDELTNADDSLAEKILSYNRANRSVAILCNHQRAVPKGHEKSMEKLKEKIEAKRDLIESAERAVKDATKDAIRGSVKEKQLRDQKKKQLERLRAQLAKLEIQVTDRDENKTIALGTSKLNYLDPRITVAWCKKHEVPIEKIYNKTQRDKFRWAIDMAGPDFVF